MKGWMMLASGPDTAGPTPRKRIVAVSAGDSDAAFEAARAAVAGFMPESIGPLSDDVAAALGLAPGKHRVLGSF